MIDDSRHVPKKSAGPVERKGRNARSVDMHSMRCSRRIRSMSDVKCVTFDDGENSTAIDVKLRTTELTGSVVSWLKLSDICSRRCSPVRQLWAVV